MGVRLADIHLSQTLRKAGALCTGYDLLLLACDGGQEEVVLCGCEDDFPASLPFAIEDGISFSVET
ncbi:hypothetical protein DVH24_012159 [Malus domestica]|uniref:Uncharacterized protein n=1 Tax=Malus domestica TaxID=3750 RepID=A0A498HSD5_MALDO|nr:hypothetical protein DVH24_012159 [Malus domestica]